MAPATPIDSSGAVSTFNGTTLSIRVPARARAGLYLLAVIARPPASSRPDFEGAGWDVLGEAAAHGSIALLRRAATDVEPAAYTFDFAGLIAAGDPPPMGALLVVTGVASDGAAVDVQGAAIAAAGAFTAPSGTAASYADAVLAVFHAGNAGGFNAIPASEVIDVSGTDAETLAGSLLVTWENPEAPGPTGTRTAVPTVAGPKGSAALFVVKSSPPAQPTRIERATPAGVGLARVGV